MKKHSLSFLLVGLFSISNMSFSQVRVLADGSLQGNQSGAIRINTGYGYLDLGPKTTSTCLFSTDRPSFTFNKVISMPYFVLTGANSYVPSNFNLYYSGGAYPSLVLTTSACGIMRGPNSPQYTLDVGGIIRGTNLSPTHSGSKANNKPIEQTQVKNLFKLEGINYFFDVSEIPNYDEKNLKEGTPMNDFYTREHLGFDLVQLEKYFPELIYRDSIGQPGIINDEFLPLIVEALKTQQELIESLEKEIEFMKSRDNKEASIIEFSETYECELGHNVPNPFNENTTIEFFISSSVSQANLYIYDLQGKQLRSFPLAERGKGQIIIYGSELQPGIYNYSLVADGKLVGIEKMVLTD